MASSGSVRITTQSVDYGGGRGAIYLYNTVGWNVDNNGNISFTSISSEDNVGGTWGVCGSSAGYGLTLEPQVSYNGGSSWVSLDSKFYEAAICPSLTNTIQISTVLIGQLGSYHLNGNCQLRFLYYANRTPAPSASLPNSFPNASYSAAVQVPVEVDVSWNASIKYDANGGSGAPASETAPEDSQSHSFTVPDVTPVRNHFIFHGWSKTKKVCSGTVWYTAEDAEIHPGDTVTVTEASPSVTLYAVWEYTYRPGQIMVDGVWKDCDRDTSESVQLGHADIMRDGSWVEMRTRRDMPGLEHPPAIMEDGEWASQDIGEGGACHDATY